MLASMKELERINLAAVLVLVATLLCSSPYVFANDVVHHDNVAPKQPGCDNDFILVKPLIFS